MTTIDEDALYAELKTLPDFDCLPLPAHWYKKYNIPPATIQTTRDFLESRYTIKCAVAPKDLPPLIIKEPQQNGKLVPVHPPEDIKVETISRPYVPNDGVVHPYLLEIAEKEREIASRPSEPVCTYSQTAQTLETPSEVEEPACSHEPNHQVSELCAERHTHQSPCDNLGNQPEYSQK